MEPRQPSVKSWRFVRELREPLHRRVRWWRKSRGPRDADLSRGIALDWRFPDPGGRLATAYADQQEDAVTGVRHLLGTLSLLPAVRNQDLAACSRLFQEVLRQDASLANIVLMNPQGEVLASGRPVPGRVILADHKHVRDAMRDKEFSAGEYRVGPISGTPVLAFAQPLLDPAGNVTGLLTAGLRLDRFAQQFQQAALPPDSILSILDLIFLD